jgi:hypothetical protein
MKFMEKLDITKCRIFSANFLVGYSALLNVFIYKIDEMNFHWIFQKYYFICCIFLLMHIVNCYKQYSMHIVLKIVKVFHIFT